MQPAKFTEQEDTSQDSFLDVVANVVGVLIILVMLVGVRASHDLLSSRKNEVVVNPTQVEKTPVQEFEFAKHDIARLQSELETATRKALNSQREIQKMATRVLRINHEAAVHDQQRNELALHRAAIEQDLERRRNELASDQQQEFDVQRQLMESQLKLEELTHEQLALATAPSEIEEVECVPTPLAKTVEEEAIHLRVSKGLVSIVPLEELLREIDYHVDDIRRQLQSRDEVIETIGPINGYRLRFTIAKQNPTGAVLGPRVGQLSQAVYKQYAEVLPTAENMGQNVEQALMPGSILYEHLQSHRRKSPPIVVWLYTDSFSEFRTLKRAIWEMGYSLATRPLPPGAQIGASPQGSKSSAQ